MKKNKKRLIVQKDYLRDAMEIFLGYIGRKMKENADYDPHPTIKAFEIAFSKIMNVKSNKPVMAISGRDGRQPISVILKKENGKIILEKIIDLTTGNEIPVSLLIQIFRLQIQLDKEGDDMKTERLTEILNEIFLEFHFHALGDKWPEARDQFIEDMKKGKIVFPKEGSEQLTKDLLSVRTNTPWEEYPSSVRAIIAGSARQFFDERNGTIVISTPPTLKNDKNKIFEIIYQQYLGKGKDFFGKNTCDFCQIDDELKKSIISIWDYFVLVADRYPINKNHLLIFPKIHVRAMGDLPLVQINELEELIETVLLIYKAMGYEEYSIIEGGFKYQGIYHAHIHILPKTISLEKEISQIIEEVKFVNNWGEVVEFYKKYGSYILLKNKDGMFVGKTNFKNKEFENKSLSEILGSKWKNEKNDKLLSKKSRQRQIETLKEWEEYRAKRKK